MRGIVCGTDGAQPSGMHILLVDDSATARAVLGRALRMLGGNPFIDEASNGQEALERMAASRPDLVLSDVNMPVMSGRELLAEIRSLGNATPFALVSADRSAELKEFAASREAVVLHKPFTVDQLRTCIAQTGGGQ